MQSHHAQRPPATSGGPDRTAQPVPYRPPSAAQPPAGQAPVAPPPPAQRPVAALNPAQLPFQPGPPPPGATAPGAMAELRSNLAAGSVIDRISDRVGGQVAFRRLLIASLAFLALFAILFVYKTLSDRTRFIAQTAATFETELRGAARTTSRALDAQAAQMSAALSMSRDPRTVLDLARRSDIVLGAAVLDGQSRVLAETPGAGTALAQVGADATLGDGQTRIESLIKPDTGETTPVVVMRSQGLYLLTALRPGSLVGADTPNRALVMNSGRLIDAPAAIGRIGSFAAFGVGSDQLSAFANTSADGVGVSATDLADGPVWLGAAAVPKSGGALIVLDTRPRALPGFLRGNLVLFGLMFLGMAWLIWMLMSQLLRQIDAVRQSQDRDETATRRYQAAVETSGGGIWEVDLSRNAVFLSASLARLLGMAEREANISLPQFLGLFEPADRDRLYNAIRRAHISGAFALDLNVAQLPLSVSCRGRPSERSTDSAKIIVGMAIDITEMRGTQVRLQAAEARLFDALRGMNDSFVIWDQMDRLVLWNRKFEEFFGFEPGNLQPGMEYAVVEHYANQVVDSTTVLEDGTGAELGLSDGRWLRYLETRTQDGGRVSIGTDVTTIRAREAELEANRDRLEDTINVLRASQSRIVELAESYEQEKIRAEQASQSKSEFLANMSHELRTPLNAINGFSDIMKKEMFGPLGDARYREYVSDILFSGQHLLSLINDILDMSKIEAGKMSLNVESLSIDKMIQQVLRIVRGRADENRLKLHYSPVEAQDIEADPRAVKQVLLNLATNAIKFTPEGGSVTIQVDPRATGLIVHVTDTGIGISEEDIARLAQPFEQIDSQHSRQHEGTGLGLALSKSLVELHGGNFGITSELGRGTTVTFTLPNTPTARPEPKSDSEVGDEISKLAEDIASVLEGNDAARASARPEVDAPEDRAA